MFHVIAGCAKRLKGLAVSALAVVQGWTQTQSARMHRLRKEYRRVLDLEARKSDFLYLAAHELRTPLAVARGYIEMVESRTLDPAGPEATEALRRADGKLAEMNELVTQMAEMARLQDESQVRLELVDVRDIVREALDRTEALAGSRHRLVADDPGRPVQVMADRFRFRTILTNLIENAIKYSPEGGEIRVSVKNSDGSVRVSVSDQGVGIDPSQLDTLFRPFSRLRPARAVAGLGLGLYVAREIARAHRGALSASLNAGGGSTFVVTLPTVH
jgi:signal transduction histidine kinase